MDYEKKKDSHPKDTLNKIKAILKRIGIDSLEELILTRIVDEHCTESVRIYLPEDFFCGTNGKGTTLEYARASAYGEFMERIQYPYILKFLPPDNKKISVKDFFKSDTLKFFLDDKQLNDKNYLNKVSEIITDFSKYKPGKIADTIPYNHINSNKVVYLPPKLKWYTSISTGSSAGNTLHEALVEGFCEIFERYVQTKAIIDPISFPDIPEEIYLKYDSIKKIIDYIKKLNFKVQVKDASLNGEYPVICTIIKTQDETGYFACFGSHPSLPVAIERCFTETMQGVDISNKKNIDFIFKYKGKKDNNIKYAKYDNALWHKYIELNNDFFTKTPDYIFNKDIWDKNENLSNKELAQNIINKLINKNINVFIRDVNFLGFPASQIYIPELMSCFKLIDDKDGETLKYNNYKADTIFKKNINANLNVCELIDFFNYLFHLKTKYSHNDYKNLELYFVILLIINKKYERALNILKTMKDKIPFFNKKRIINFFIEYIILTQTKQKDIKSKLRDKYGKFTTNRLFKLFLSGRGIKNLILIMKSRQIYADIKNKAGIKRKEEIIKNILKEYKDNIPNQALLKEKIYDTTN